MNISKFLLIDAGFVITTTLLLFLFKGDNKIFRFLGSTNEKNFFKNNSFKLPERKKVAELEKLAKKEGSGIDLDSLTGDWKFISVRNKDNDEEDIVFSSLLRLFSANIEFKKDNSVEHSTKFLVISSIQFGIFTIEF